MELLSGDSLLDLVAKPGGGATALPPDDSVVGIYMYIVYQSMVYMKIHVYSTLAKLVVKEEKKENPDPIHHTRTVQIHKHKVNSAQP